MVLEGSRDETYPYYSDVIEGRVVILVGFIGRCMLYSFSLKGL